MTRDDPMLQPEFAAYTRAIAQLERARALLAEIGAAPGAPGVELARRRVAKAEKALVRATVVFTGRPLTAMIDGYRDEL